MTNQEIYNEVMVQDVDSNVWMVGSMAQTNAGDVFGPITAANRVEWLECFVGSIRGALCDVDCYGVSCDTVVWFATRGIKG